MHFDGPDGEIDAFQSGDATEALGDGMKKRKLTHWLPP
jgi:hypothetical protein